MNKLILTIAILIPFCSINGQSEEKILLNEGIEAYKKGQFSTALDLFNDSYTTNGAYNKSVFNAANAALLNDSLTIAKDLLSEYISISENKLDKSKGYYDIGNIQYNEYEQLAKDPKESQKAIAVLKESIESYKKAVRNNPNDKDARYNLSLAMSKIPPPSDNQDKKDENKDEQKDQENKDEQKDGEGKDKKDQENKDGEKKEDGEKGDQKEDGEKGDQDKEGEKGDQPGDEKEDKKGEEEQKGNQGKEGEEKGEEEMMGKISRMQATKDLDAMNNEEQKTLMKISRKKGGEQKENSSSKDW